ncbi:MAG: DUF2460 domain-containing protein [Pseudomonadota bacterium]
MFHDVLFSPRAPLRVTVSSTFVVETAQLSSGMEQRNARTAHARRTYTLPVGVRPVDELREILTFYEARHGPLHGFRFRDPFLNTTAHGSFAPTLGDVQIGVGDGAAVVFQMLRRDGSPATKPDAASVKVAVDGTALAKGTDFAVDPLTGLVTLATAPAAGALITAGCNFDMAVRFSNGTLTLTQTTPGAGEIDDLQLLEVSE